MLPNIVLIGFMGSGKSSVGRHVSEMTGHRFVDTDLLVTQKAGMGIPRIFRERGEEEFRKMETEVLRELVGVCGIVLATGGGLVLRDQNRELLHEIGIVVWLDAEPDVIFERVSRTQKRPLLATENPRATFDELREKRLPVYEEAAITRIDSTGLTHQQAARKVIEAASRQIHQPR
jgi:shikimate kinase